MINFEGCCLRTILGALWLLLIPLAIAMNVISWILIPKIDYYQKKRAKKAIKLKGIFRYIIFNGEFIENKEIENKDNNNAHKNLFFSQEPSSVTLLALICQILNWLVYVYLIVISIIAFIYNLWTLQFVTIVTAVPIAMGLLIVFIYVITRGMSENFQTKNK